MAWTKRTPITTDFVKRTDIYPNFPSDENLVGYWSLDEGSGSKAYDGSGNSNDGTLTNMEEADWVDGVVGKCLDIDDTDEYVDCGNNAIIMPDTFSISFWIKLDSYTDVVNTVFGWQGALSTACFNINHNSGRALLYMGSSNFRYFSGVRTIMNDNEWHHVVVILPGAAQTDISSSKLYIDNVEITGSAATTSAVQATKVSFYIGKNGSYRSKGMLIDEVRLYKTALTAKEVSALYKYPAGNKGDVSDFNKIGGDAKPEDNATLGATFGIDINKSEFLGQFPEPKYLTAEWAQSQNTKFSCNGDAKIYVVTKLTSNYAGYDKNGTRYTFNTVTNIWDLDYNVAIAANSNHRAYGCAKLGNYIYVYGYWGIASERIKRYDLDWSNATAITYSDSTGSGGMTSDGTYLYLIQGDTVQKISISGTTATDVSTFNIVSATDTYETVITCDGTYLYIVKDGGGNIYRYTLDGASLTTFTGLIPNYAKICSGIIYYGGKYYVVLHYLKTQADAADYPNFYLNELTF